MSSAAVLLRGPAPPKEFLGAPFFRDCWIEGRFPTLACLVALVCQVLLVVYPPPVWNVRPLRQDSAPQQMDLTWYKPESELPPVAPHHAAPEPPAAKPPENAPNEENISHPRQTIISNPLHPTHPRQTLIQPQAPPEPPKILPALPNLVQLATSELTMPRVELPMEQFQQLRPKLPVPVKQGNIAAPDVPAQRDQTDLMNLASSETVPKPALPVMPMAAPKVNPHKQDVRFTLPHFAMTGPAGPMTLIALSANPALAPPPPTVPPGNLSARFSVSPGATKPRLPDKPSANGSMLARGPEGIFIGSPTNNARSPKLGITAAGSVQGEALPSRPLPRIMIPSSNSKPLITNSRPAALSPGAPEAILGSKRVYRLLVNMPNLTSATGSWVLNFTEMDDTDQATRPQAGVPQLTGPVPLRKVDPKYPPELRAAHVEGEVVLYAIIRKDGSVDSIQLVSGPDPQLETNAMQALAQWKFKPAKVNGVPVDLEAVVHVPFHWRAPDSY